MFFTKEMWKSFFAISLLFFLIFSSSGCSVFLAARQPKKKNLAVINGGMSRSVVIAELGQPVVTEDRNGKKVDVFSFQQGYKTWVKVTRAVMHGLLDIGTFFIWEIIGTPIEIVADGEQVKVEVIYGNDNLVEAVNFL